MKNIINRNYPKSRVTEYILQTIAEDFISNLNINREGNKHIFVFVDTFSKYVKLVAWHRTNVTVT